MVISWLVRGRGSDMTLFGVSACYYAYSINRLWFVAAYRLTMRAAYNPPTRRARTRDTANHTNST